MSHRTSRISDKKRLGARDVLAISASDVSVSAIPDEVRAFIHAHIASVEQLEVLLLLRRESARSWDGAAVARELRINPDSASSRLADLHARGLLDRVDAEAYQFSRNGDVERVVSAVARCYSELRVSVINLIFSKPVDKIRSFADAFKLKGGGS